MEMCGQDTLIVYENQFKNDEANMFLIPFEYNPPLASHNYTEEKNNSEEDIETNQQESKEEVLDYEGLLARKEIKRKKRIHKKIKKEMNKINKMVFVIENSLSKELFKLNCGIFITLDGVLRYCYCLTPISFGFYPTRIVKIEERKNLGIINIHHQIDRLVPKRSIEDCVNLMMNRNIANLNYYDLSNQLESFNQTIKQIYNFNKINEQMRSFKEQEFQEFIQFAFDYVEQIQKNESNKFFIFNIGRYNYIDQEVELAHTGFSKSYLCLLGLDCDSFKTVLLRNQKIDLIKEKSDVIFQALKGISLKMLQNPQDSYTANINTFDGYPLEVCYSVRNLHFSQTLNSKFSKGYILSFIQATLSPHHMKGLIDYRQKLMQNYKNFSIDEYIRKELSYFFEDVEYSVKSQQFIEKYYQENLKNLIPQEQSTQMIDNNSQDTSSRGIFM